MQISISTALEKLKASEKLFLELFDHGTLHVEIYKPVEKDLQQPHEKDEIYITISGTGEFINGKNKTHFRPGDFLFVPAGTEHRFINFTNDFSTWVIFLWPCRRRKPGVAGLLADSANKIIFTARPKISC